MKLKLDLKGLETSTTLTRSKIYNTYYRRYYNLFMNHFVFNGLREEQANYILRRFWADGRVACFKVKNSETDMNPFGEIVFTPYAPTRFNIYDFPIEATPINSRGASFIPSIPMKVGTEIILGYIQRDRKNVFNIVDFYLSKITDVEMVLRTNLKAHKTPWLIGVNPESDYKMKLLYKNLDSDEPKLIVETDDANNFKSLVSGAPYIIDKLYEYKMALENELKEYLAFNNMGICEKKEHLINSEIEANNEMITSSGDCFLDVLKDFIKRINEAFGTNYSVELNQAIEYIEGEEYEEEEEDKDNE